MLFTNVFNAIEAFVTANIKTIGDILATLYESQSNSTEVVLPIDNMNITLDVLTQLYNSTFWSQLSDQNITILACNVFGKIFDSYGLSLPPEYGELVNGLENGTYSYDNGTLAELGGLLFGRFTLSAVSYLVSCVIIWYRLNV